MSVTSSSLSRPLRRVVVSSVVALLLLGGAAGVADAAGAPAPGATVGDSSSSTGMPSAPIASSFAADTVHPDAAAASGTWAAIAVGTRSGRAGYAAGYRTASAAVNAAVNKCGRSDCRAVVDVSNGCAALAQARNGNLGWAYARSLATAENAAKKATKASGASVLGYACAGYYTR